MKAVLELAIEKFLKDDKGKISELHKHTLCCIAYSMGEKRPGIYNRNQLIDCSIIQQKLGKEVR